MNTESSALLSEMQKQILVKLANASLTPKAIANRAKIIILYAQGASVPVTCTNLGMSHTPIYKWRNRWPNIKTTLDQIEKEKTKHELEAAIKAALNDAPRSGAPPHFKEEQVMQIIALACTSPEAEGLPVSHWSCRLLAEHAQELGIVESISFKQVNNFLKSGGVKTS
jgi:putative transposase